MDYKKTFRGRTWHRIERWPYWKKWLAGIAIIPLLPVALVAFLALAIGSWGWDWIDLMFNPNPPESY